MAAIPVLVCNDMRFFRFAHFSHGKIKVSVRSLNICLDSIHVLYISMEFLVAANCRCELKATQNWLVVLGSRISSSLQNLKFMNMSRTLLPLVLTLAFVFVSCGFSEKSGYLKWKWHRNKIYTRFYVSVMVVLSC